MRSLLHLYVFYMDSMKHNKDKYTTAILQYMIYNSYSFVTKPRWSHLKLKHVEIYLDRATKIEEVCLLILTLPLVIGQLEESWDVKKVKC